MTERFKVLMEQDLAEGVWVTSVPGLNWLSTYGESRQEALEQTRQAILGSFEASSGPPSR
jgi:predicted RNase H-like HicB family nuclease